ncbi:MAG: 3-deoxy-7-phosphoheptulonate synthase [Halioglobus sp.]
MGFKNGTNGAIEVAIDAIRSAQHSHRFPSLTKEGTPAILKSQGNPHSYLILRGGSVSGPNYKASDVEAARKALIAQKQTTVLASLCQQIEEGQKAIRGVMLESHLLGGTQKVIEGQPLNYGRSITDACLSLADTAPLLEKLAAVVRTAAN